MVRVVAGVPVSPTSVLSFGWVSRSRERISYPVMVGSSGSSQVRVTEDVVEVARRFVGMAGGGGSLVDMLTKREGWDWPSSLRATTRKV